MVDAIDTTEKAQFHIVTFFFGDPGGYLRFTNWDSDIDPGGLNITSMPSMEIDLAPISGVFQETPTKIKMTLDSDNEVFLDPMSRGTTFSPTKITVEEIINPVNIGDAGSTKFVASGRLHRTRRNADGKNNLVILEVRSEKSLLDTKLGFQVNPNCGWRLNGPGCNGSTWGPSGYLSRSISISIDGKLVTADDSLLQLDLGGTKTWTRGYLELDGAAVMIFYYDKSQDGNVSKEFQMVRQPPPEWDGKAVNFYPGCSKQIDGDGGCRLAWGNEEGFGGSGYAVPAYNPISENPQGD